MVTIEKFEQTKPAGSNPLKWPFLLNNALLPSIPGIQHGFNYFQTAFLKVFFQDRSGGCCGLPGHLQAPLCLRKQHRLLPRAGGKVAPGADPCEEPGREHPIPGSHQLDGPVGHGQDVFRHSERQGWRWDANPRIFGFSFIFSFSPSWEIRKNILEELDSNPSLPSSGESKEKAAVNGPFQTCLFGGSNSRVF